MKIHYILVLLLGFLVRHSLCVNRADFKTCEQSSFCKRCRSLKPGESKFQIVPSSVSIDTESVTADLLNTENNQLFVFKFQALKHDIFHFIINEKTPIKERYRVVDALVRDPVVEIINNEISESQINVTYGNHRAVIYFVPFKIDIFLLDQLSVSINAKGLMRFEHLRPKPTGYGTTIISNSIEDNFEGSWEEDFNGHIDSKPNGPEAISLDFTFSDAKVLFGIPEHADSFALKPTTTDSSVDPYRLYNLDVANHELNNGMSLYGAVPVIYGHGPSITAGVFWQNAAETWIDIYPHPSNANNSQAANFMSESGIIDTFILLGPTPNNAFKQFTDLTGVAPLPQLYTLAYHQSRWNYESEEDLKTVSTMFDVHQIPMDTMWLDIEYTDGKRYFTWDPETFPNPLEMISNLTATGRHLTVIIDVHIKRDDNYFFHTNCTAKNFYTKDKYGADFIGECWPGVSGYPDVFNPELRKYFADQYLVENFHGTTENVMIWNDMNEPSVFNGPEITMLKDNIHYGGWEHRDVHNLFGHMQLKSTFDGLTRRSKSMLRPFILTRSHFAGSQRYAAIWTGDNTASWDFLAVSIKTCLSEAVAGISFCGADVGGFMGRPSAELFARWYQAAAFQPFFRSHSHIETPRREPWLYSDSVILAIRNAIRRRYSFLPLWYTLFYEHERYGLPVMRPLLSKYTDDVKTFSIDDEYLLGDVLLVRPVLEKGASTVDVYFPTTINGGPGDLWYDIDDYSRINETGYIEIDVHLSKTPVYYRGGTIIPKKEQIRQTSTFMKTDPYTLIICVDRNNIASGTLYIDDETSYDYQNGKYNYITFVFNTTGLTKITDENARYDTEVKLDRIIFAGLPETPKSAQVEVDGQTLNFDIIVKDHYFYIQHMNISIVDTWSLKFNSGQQFEAALSLCVSMVFLILIM